MFDLRHPEHHAPPVASRSQSGLSHRRSPARNYTANMVYLYRRYGRRHVFYCTSNT